MAIHKLWFVTGVSGQPGSACAFRPFTNCSDVHNFLVFMLVANRLKDDG